LRLYSNGGDGGGRDGGGGDVDAMHCVFIQTVVM
jgi:hypothetical protein